MNHLPAHSKHARHAHGGFSLIELMIAMVLGLIVVGGVLSVFLAGQQSYRTNVALGDVQDGARVAFEMLARDIRNAGLTGCNNNGRMANVINSGSSYWWADWSNALHGYGGGQTDPAVVVGTGSGQRVSGTDSLLLLGIADTGMTVAASNNVSSTEANFKLNEKTSNLQTGDVIIVCDQDHAAMVQISDYQPSSGGGSSGVTVVHNTGNKTSPGNCSKGLGYPTTCTTNGNSYSFGPNSQIAKLVAADWYIGNNPDGGRSLYRKDVNFNTGAPAEEAQEMVRNVTALQLFYHEASGTGFTDAVSVGNWSQVNAVQMTLTLESTDKLAGTDAKPLQRVFSATTAVRNRVN